MCYYHSTDLRITKAQDCYYEITSNYFCVDTRSLSPDLDDVKCALHNSNIVNKELRKEVKENRPTSRNHKYEEENGEDFI